MTTSISQLQEEAKKIAQIKNLKFNQALQYAAQAKGYKNYQSLLNKIKHDFIHSQKTESGVLEAVKKNIFDNRKVIINKFKIFNKLEIKEKELQHLTIDDDTAEEMSDDIYDQATHTGNELAKIVSPSFLRRPPYCVTSEVDEFTFGYIYLYDIQTEYDFLNLNNDIHGENCDFFIEFSCIQNSIEFIFYEDIKDREDPERYIVYEIENPIHYTINTSA